MGYWLDTWLVDCCAKVKANDLAQRTLDDYTKNLVPLKVFFGPMAPAAITPKHVQTYLGMQAEAGRPVRGNR